MLPCVPMTKSFDDGVPHLGGFSTKLTDMLVLKKPKTHGVVTAPPKLHTMFLLIHRAAMKESLMVFTRDS